MKSLEIKKFDRLLTVAYTLMIIGFLQLVLDIVRIVKEGI